MRLLHIAAQGRFGSQPVARIASMAALIALTACAGVDRHGDATTRRSAEFPSANATQPRTPNGSFSEERLERIDRVMQANVEAGLIPGAVGLIWRDGEIAYLKSFGYEDIDEAEPMQTDSLFRIFSMTKPITSVGVMMLYEEGRFLLSDPVEKYLPELGGLEVALAEQDESREGIETAPATRPITIQDLLRHTAGMTYGFFGESPVDAAYVESGILVTDATIAETVRKLGDLPLQYEPGTRWHYSVATDVLGRLIEVVSGQPLDVFFRERIFEPLEMHDTAFSTGPERGDRLAELYMMDETGRLIESTETRMRNYVDPTTHFSGGGGLVSTAEDYLRFTRMLLNGGELDGVRLLGPKTVALMTSDNLGGINPNGFDHGRTFGLGFGINTDPGATGELGSAGEYGWGGLAGTRFWIDPAENLIGIYMVQILPPRPADTASQFKVLVEQALLN